jgi:hypothetical protein
VRSKTSSAAPKHTHIDKAKQGDFKGETEVGQSLKLDVIGEIVLIKQFKWRRGLQFIECTRRWRQAYCLITLLIIELIL